GMITKVALTDASVPDHTAFIQESLAPTDGMVFMDKGYDCDGVYEELRRRKVASGVIMKRNRKQKNYALDRWRSKIRMPFEGAFSKMPKLTRFRTKIKVKFEVVFQALVHNCKRLAAIHEKLAPG
ncbi:transposase, partial [Oligoflexia bacterium]|nr:transposase [Oligoflexia bacterium]